MLTHTELKPAQSFSSTPRFDLMASNAEVSAAAEQSVAPRKEGEPLKEVAAVEARVREMIDNENFIFEREIGDLRDEMSRECQ